MVRITSQPHCTRTMLQQRACPSGRAQSLNMGAGGNFCFNCRHSWRQPDPSITAAGPHTDAYPFTEAEMQRLAIYKRAVAAGFFTDWS